MIDLPFNLGNIYYSYEGCLGNLYSAWAIVILPTHHFTACPQAQPLDQQNWKL
jgi:hypothetical protein